MKIQNNLTHHTITESFSFHCWCCIKEEKKTLYDVMCKGISNGKRFIKWTLLKTAVSGFSSFLDVVFGDKMSLLV